MGRRSAAEMEQKAEVLRRITGGKPFSFRDLFRDLPGLLSQLDYTTQEGLRMFLHALSTVESMCGRQLNMVGRGKYVWINPSNGSTELVKPVSPHHLARDLNPDEAAALEVVKEIMTKTQDGVIRLVPNMLAMNKDEFLDFMEKLESVKATAKIGANGQSIGGYVWGLVRDKFSDFYQIAQAVRSGQYEFPREEPAVMAPEPATPPRPVNQKTAKVPTLEKLATAMCEAAGEEIAESDKKIKSLEAELVQIREARVESVRRFNLFRQELNKLQNK